MTRNQLGLFTCEPQLPEGFQHISDLLTVEEERALVGSMSGLPFREFEFRGYVGRRRVVSYGWRYDFNTMAVEEAEPIPPMLLSVREMATRFAGLQPDAFPHVLLTEYGPGASIGWHKDKAVFGNVVDVSLNSPCTFRFRRKVGSRWQRASLTLEPRSAYLLRGPSRTEWEHSIPAVESLRYSITFRTLAHG
jgi:alkylated DNA repair dioxygenase AlkB